LEDVVSEATQSKVNQEVLALSRRFKEKREESSGFFSHEAFSI